MYVSLSAPTAQSTREGWREHPQFWGAAQQCTAGSGEGRGNAEGAAHRGADALQPQSTSSTVSIASGLRDCSTVLSPAPIINQLEQLGAAATSDTFMCKYRVYNNTLTMVTNTNMHTTWNLPRETARGELTQL